MKGLNTSKKIYYQSLRRLENNEILTTIKQILKALISSKKFYSFLRQIACLY